MKAMMDLMKTMFSLPVPVRIWLAILMILNMAVPLVFIATPEGMATIASAMAGVITMTWLYQAKGFVRLMGIGHIYWVPLVLWFLTRLELAEPGSLFFYWMLSIIVLNTISLVIDTMDIFRYVKGERAPYVG